MTQIRIEYQIACDPLCMPDPPCMQDSVDTNFILQMLIIDPRCKFGAKVTVFDGDSAETFNVSSNGELTRSIKEISNGHQAATD